MSSCKNFKRTSQKNTVTSDLGKQTGWGCTGRAYVLIMSPNHPSLRQCSLPPPPNCEIVCHLKGRSRTNSMSFTSRSLLLCVVDHNHFCDLQERRVLENPGATGGHGHIWLPQNSRGKQTAWEHLQTFLREVLRQKASLMGFDA